MVFDFDTTVPNANHTPAQDQPTMQTNNASTSQLIEVDHIGFNIATAGQHKKVTFNTTQNPADGTPYPLLFTKVPAGLSLPELFFYSGNAANSATQYVASGGGSTFCLGGIIIKWGNYGAGGDNNNISFSSICGSNFPNACYSVTITPVSSSNVTNLIYVIQGTLGPTGFKTSKVPIGNFSFSNFPIFFLAIGA